MFLHNDQILGFYKPTFFQLSINSENVLDEQNRIAEEFDGIFFHEYIHFLQDLLTCYGLVNISNMVKEYSIINQEIIRSPDPTFTIPYHSPNDDLTFSKIVLNSYWGTEEVLNDMDDFEVIGMSHEPYLLHEELKQLSLVTLEIIYKPSLEKDKIYLGAVHFMENIAGLLQRRFTQVDDLPWFPYKVVEKLIWFLFPDGERSDQNLLFFMEHALDSYNPAEYLYQFRSYCDQIGSSFCRESIFSFLMNYKMVFEHQMVKLDKLYYANCANARRGLRILFNHEHLIKVREWVDLVFSNAIKLKRAGFTFTELLPINGDKNIVSKKMGQLVRKLGTPVIMDRQNRWFVMAPRNDLTSSMAYLLGIEAVMNVINGDLRCDLIPYCQNGPGGIDITDANCESSPWNRVHNQNRCLFAQLWIMWGFVQKEVL